MLDDPHYLDLFGGELARTAAKSFVRALHDTDVGFAEAVQQFEAQFSRSHRLTHRRSLDLRVAAILDSCSKTSPPAKRPAG